MCEKNFTKEKSGIKYENVNIILISVLREIILINSIKISEMNKLSSKSKHKEILKSLRLRKLEEKMKINMKKRKQILKKSKDG